MVQGRKWAFLLGTEIKARSLLQHSVFWQLLKHSENGNQVLRIQLSEQNVRFEILL